MVNCCRLGRAPSEEGRILYESDNFLVFPTLGPIGIKGYLLIASKKHYEGTGDMPEGLLPELEELITMTKSKLMEAYRKESILFEHGPKVGNSGWGGGTSIDHAHLHVIPGVDITSEFAVSLMMHLDKIGKFYKVDRLEGFKRTGEIFHSHRTSYVVFETPDNRRLVSEINFPGESQWLRQLTARKIGSERWNWRLYPDRETMRKTFDDLVREF